MQQQLNVNTREVEDLLIDLILEGKVEGRIDQAGKRLELDSKYVLHFPSTYMCRLLIDVLHPDKVWRRNVMLRYKSGLMFYRSSSQGFSLKPLLAVGQEIQR